MLGFAVASAGGPFAIAAVYMTGSAHVAPSLLVPATVIGLALFLAPLTIWLRYSAAVASGGGLYAFVRHAAGERLARWQGWIWTVAYLLYLPYTVTDIVYYLMPAFLPLSAPGQVLLEILLPVAICLLIAFGGRMPVVLLLVSGAVQLAALSFLGALTLHGAHLQGWAVVALPPVHLWPGVLGGGAQVASLLVCMSLVLFLGGEAAGGRSSLRRSLAIAFAILCASTLFSSLLLAVSTTPAVARSDLPGAVLGRLYGSPAVAAATGLVAVVSIAGLIVAEFIALTRLWGAMFDLRSRTSVAIISAFFIAADAASLLGPRRFYALAIAPSLIALYLSQFIVFAAYPLLRHRSGRPDLASWALAAVACLWSLYGVYGAVVAVALS